MVDCALWLGFWRVKYLPVSGQGGNAGVVVRVVAVITTLATVIAEVTNIPLAEAVGAHARGFAVASIGIATDVLGGNGTDASASASASANANATNQGDTEPASVASPHRGES